MEVPRLRPHLVATAQPRRRTPHSARSQPACRTWPTSSPAPTVRSCRSHRRRRIPVRSVCR